MISIRVLIVIALVLLPSCSTPGRLNKGPKNKTPFRDPPASSLFAGTQPPIKTCSVMVISAFPRWQIQKLTLQTVPLPHCRRTLVV